jgi:ribosomal protein S18 acetylase RimI-like enzyme
VSVRIREARADDLEFVREILGWAACWREGEIDPARIEDPLVSRYADGFGRTGDAGVIAMAENGRPVGAAWYRSFAEDEPGYGFVAAEIPEIAIGVIPDFRGRRVGSALLSALIELARTNGCPALSLSVETDNPAVHLYERAGFRGVGRSGEALTMKLDLDQSALATDSK